jgi:hypothetical protein
MGAASHRAPLRIFFIAVGLAHGAALPTASAQSQAFPVRGASHDYAIAESRLDYALPGILMNVPDRLDFDDASDVSSVRFSEAYSLHARRDKMHYSRNAWNPAAFGRHFDTLRAGFTARQGQSSLMFFCAVSRSLPKLSRAINGLPVHGDNSSSLKIGSLLALGPASAVRMAFEFARVPDIRTEAGSLTAQNKIQPGASLTGAYSFALSPRAVLDIELSLGLTSNVPDVRILASIPIRF